MLTVSPELETLAGALQMSGPTESDPVSFMRVSGAGEFPGPRLLDLSLLLLRPKCAGKLLDSRLRGDPGLRQPNLLIHRRGQCS
jgi:hypothetical protein